MSRRLAATAILSGIVLSGCAAPSAVTKPAGPTASATRKPSLRFVCTFGAEPSAIHRTYTLTGNSLVEQGSSKRRYRISSDTGDRITAEHLDPATKLPVVIEIDLRRHTATLNGSGKDAATPKSLDGTCAPSG